MFKPIVAGIVYGTIVYSLFSLFDLVSPYVSGFGGVPPQVKLLVSVPLGVVAFLAYRDFSRGEGSK